jgi:protein-arginine deiminase
VNLGTGGKVALGIAVAVTAYVGLRGLSGASKDAVNLKNAVVRACRGAPQILVVPGDEIAFGGGKVGAPGVTRTLRVSNIGNAPLTLSPLAVVGGNTADFVPGALLPATLAAGEQVDVPIVFTPGAAGDRASTLRIASDDPNRPTVDVRVSGRGLRPRIEVVDTLAFGRAGVNGSLRKRVQLHNGGDAELVVTATTAVGDDAAHFTVPAQAVALRIPPGADAPLDLRFAPTALGDKAARVRIASDDPDTPARETNLTGRAEARLAHLYLDEDRNGAVDDDPASCATWTWGAAGRGAILLVKTRIPQNVGGGDNVAGPVAERIAIKLRWQGQVPADALDGWRAQLNVSRPGAVRLYATRANNAPVIPIPGDGNVDLTARITGHQEVELFVEATGYPGAGGDTFGAVANDGVYSSTEAHWRVLFTFTFTDGEEKVRQVSQLRLAPWIMASDADPTARLCFRGPQEVADPPREPVRYVLALRGALLAALGGACGTFEATVSANPGIVGNSKNFARDAMKAGFTSAPHCQTTTLVENLDPEAPVTTLPGRLMRTAGIADVGILRAHTEGSAQTNGGNLLAAPPRAGQLFGPMVIGHTGEARCGLRSFLLAQRLQSVVELDSSWLRVGHVDEYVSFVPSNAGGPWPHKVLLASARLAHILCWACAARPAGNVDETIATALALSTQTRANGLVLPTDDALQLEFGALRDAVDLGAIATGVYVADPAPPLNSDGQLILWARVNQNGSPRTARHYCQDADARGHRLATQTAIDADRARLRVGLNVTQAEFVEIPVMFKPEDEKYVGLTADSVNLVLINNGGPGVCIVPKPFGPVMNGTYIFQRAIQMQLEALGLTVHFVNDWNDFHRNDGEIHCGTNHLPINRNISWWRIENGPM